MIASAQTSSERSLIDGFDQEFARLQVCSCSLIDATPAEMLYEKPATCDNELVSGSIGEYVIRSAGVVEQTFGGITTNLWDDPFEWTLPETLNSRERVKEYLAEVEQTRQRAFVSFDCDQNLLKKVAAPSGNMRPLVSLLLDTLVRSVSFQGRAVALAEMFSIAPSDRFIISRSVK